MIIKSLNIAQPQTVRWRLKTIQTGIYKNPTKKPLILGTEAVVGDAVMDRKYHGGVDKACYAYSSEAYLYWDQLYPDFDFSFGFFGENLTIENFSESNVRIGNQYKIGSCLVEVSQPREPCFKLGIKFGSQKIVKAFVNSDFPGAYFRVLKPGIVSLDDSMELIHSNIDEPTVLDTFKMIYGFEKQVPKLELALNSAKLAKDAMKKIKKQYTKLIS
jgi:MOSC domain-containing protein YiiM